MKKENNILALYDRYVAEGKLSDDSEQKKIAVQLDRFAGAITAVPSRKSLLQKIIPLKAAPAGKQGIYLWGDVGRGKSLLMDMFFTSVPIAAKERIHFHSLMLGIHSHIHLLRKKQDRDPLKSTALELVRKTKLICLDEFQVTDVADAMLLDRLFSILFAEGGWCVITSNRPPEELYRGGVQREKFLDFVKLIHAKMDVLPLVSPTDYRLQQMRSLKSVYLSPLTQANEQLLERIFTDMTNHSQIMPVTLEVQGRKFLVPRSCNRIARFTFQELCGQPLGPADYLAMAETFDTVFLENIPLLSPEKRNEARRFVILIDELYDHRVKLVCTAAASPEKLYPQGDGSFEFQRTVSRLVEMQSERYLSGK